MGCERGCLGPLDAGDRLHRDDALGAEVEILIGLLEASNCPFQPLGRDPREQSQQRRQDEQRQQELRRQPGEHPDIEEHGNDRRQHRLEQPLGHQFDPLGFEDDASLAACCIERRAVLPAQRIEPLEQVDPHARDDPANPSRGGPRDRDADRGGGDAQRHDRGSGSEDGTQVVPGDRLVERLPDQPQDRQVGDRGDCIAKHEQRQ